MVPNLFIVGFQKCGSSTLFHLLTKHPDIAGTNPKETFAITDKIYEHYDINKSVYNPLFSWSSFLNDDALNKKYILEASVCNFYQDTALSFIKKLPNKKVIFIVRNPVKRFESAFNYYGRGGVSIPVNLTLEKFYNQLVEGNSVYKKEGLSYALQHGKYSQYIKLWEDNIGVENVIVIGFKELVSQTRETMDKIFNFLELESIPDIILEHKNKSTSIRFPYLNKILLGIFGGFGFNGTYISKLYKKLISGKVKGRLNDSLSEKLEDYYVDEFNKYGILF